MKILFDARFLQGKRNGISNDSMAIVKVLASEGHDLLFLVYGNQNTEAIKEFLKLGNVIRVRSYRHQLIKALMGFRIDISNIDADIYFQFQISPIRLKLKKQTKSVLRIHDLFPLTNPEWFTPRSTYLFRRGFLNIQEFDLLLANSHTTANILEGLIFQKRANIQVLLCMVSPVQGALLCQECSFCKQPVDTENAFFSIGTFEPRKNHIALIEAFLIADKDRQSKLIIVGGKGWGKLALPRIYDSSISIFEDVCEGTIRLLYEKSKTFITVSFDEGFNIPLYNALAFGKKIIASDIPIHREIASGINVRWVDPHNHAEIISAIHEVKTDKSRSSTKRWDRNFTQEINVSISQL